MLDPLVVLIAQQAVDTLLLLEVYISQNAVSLHDLIENIEIQGQLVHALDLFDQLTADRASHPEVMVQDRKALGAESVAAVNQDPGNALADIKLFCAIVAKVEDPDFVVGLDKLEIVAGQSVGLHLFLGVYSFLLERVNGAFLTSSFVLEAIWPGFRNVRLAFDAWICILNRLH